MMQEHINNIVILLQKVKSHPHMYISPHIDSLVGFINGIKFGAAAFDAQINDVVYKEVINERGLEYSANGIWNQIAQQDKVFSSILNEVLDIEIEAWKRTYNIS